MVDRSKIRMTDLVNANSALALENGALRLERDALRADLAKALERAGTLEAEAARYVSVNRPKATLTSITGRVARNKEVLLRGVPSFEIFIGDKGKSMRILADVPDLARELRGCDPSAYIVLNCEMTPAGLKGINLGTIFARLVIEGTERIQVRKGDTEIEPTRTIKTYAIAGNGDRIKILSLPQDALEGRRVGETVALEGVFRSYNIKGTYYPFFLTKARLDLELDRLNNRTVAVGEAYRPPEPGDETGDIPF